MSFEYLNFPVTNRAMPLKVSSEVFAKEWRLCWSNNKSDLTRLTKLIKPFIHHWVKMLTIPSYPKDINYITLCRLISPYSEVALDSLTIYLEVARLTSSVYEELEFLYIERLRGIGYFPSQAKPIMVEYVVAQDFKYALGHRVRSAMHQTGAEHQYGLNPVDPDTIECEYEPKDVIFMSNLKLTPWETYLLELIRLGLTAPDISLLTHIKREHLFYEEKAVWHKLGIK